MGLLINEHLKISIINTIQLIENKIGMFDPYTFDALFNLNYKQLEEIRDNRIKQYNKIISDRKFTSDMIYKKKGEKEN